IDQDAFVSDVKPMTQLIRERLAPPRFARGVFSAFAGGAVSLSFAGIYAVIAHAVAQRTREIGIRIAMGASPARVTGLMLRYGLTPAVCVIAAGWLGALAISRFIAALLFGVGPLDLPTWIVVSGCMLVV